MGRPPVTRRVGFAPRVTLFKPAGIPAASLRTTPLALDELEAMRLVDGEGLDLAGAAAHMAVSRATVGRILERARHKVACALTAGEALRIEVESAPVEYRHRGGQGRGHGRGWRGGRGDAGNRGGGGRGGRHGGHHGGSS